MNKRIAIIGASDLGEQITHLVSQIDSMEIVGYFDDFATVNEKNGIPILGKIAEIDSLFEKGYFDELVIAIGYKHMKTRKEFFERFVKRIPFATIIHPTAIIDSTAKIGQGTIIYSGVTIDYKVIVKENVLINVNGVIAHHTIIGKHCFLSPCVHLAGFIKIEDACILGISTTIIDNVTIISQTQTGGGTVVIKDIKKAGLYVGNPHRFIR